MKFSYRYCDFIAVLLLAASLQPANAGLGAYSTPQRTRCEN